MFKDTSSHDIYRDFGGLHSNRVSNILTTLRSPAFTPIKTNCPQYETNDVCNYIWNKKFLLIAWIYLDTWITVKLYINEIIE